MRKLFGIKVKNIIVIWIFVDLLINIGLFICGFFISKSLALSFNPYLWLIVSIIGNFVLSSVVSFDKWRGFVDSWQIVAIIITCMHTISAVYLVIAVIASIITIFNIMKNILKSTLYLFQFIMMAVFRCDERLCTNDLKSIVQPIHDAGECYVYPTFALIISEIVSSVLLWYLVSQYKKSIEFSRSNSDAELKNQDCSDDN